MGHGPHNNPRMLARMTHAGLQLGKEAFQQEEGYCGAHRGDGRPSQDLWPTGCDSHWEGLGH